MLPAPAPAVESSGPNPTVYALTDQGGWHATPYQSTATGSWKAASLPAGGTAVKLYTPVVSDHNTGSAIAIVSGL